MDEHTVSEQSYKRGLEDGKPKWISVKDRYPDEAGFYIGFFEARPGHWRVSTLHWNGTNWNNIGGYIPTSVKTTHWMPLPEPPKTEELCEWGKCKLISMDIDMPSNGFCCFGERRTENEKEN